MSNTVKSSDLIAEYLMLKEVRVAFGIIGSANSHIFYSIHELGYTKIVTTHHEQAAVMAAGAYFRACGHISAALVTAGAGASNAITGVISNWADSVPCLILSGQESYLYLRCEAGQRMFGTQGYDNAKMVSDVTKFSACVLESTRVQDTLERAF